MATTTMKVITLEKLAQYDGLIKSYIDAADAKSIKTVAIDGNVLKFYRVEEPVGDTEPAYQIELPETDISNLLEKFEAATAGNLVSVAEDGKNIVDSGIKAADVATKAEVQAVDDKVAENTEAIEAINNADTGILAKAKAHADGKDAAIQAAQEAADAAQDGVDGLTPRVEELEAEVGDLEKLETTGKSDLVSAINEVRNAVAAGGTEAAVTMEASTTTEGMVKSYTIKQGSNVVGTIDIPKDMFVESGTVVTLADGDVEGKAAGTYIKLVLANVSEPLYINVGTLVDIYTAEQNAAQVQLAIDSSSRVISASIVAGSVGTTELADNAVTTVKIADGNVTKEKLSTAVQASLDKADKALEEANAYTDEKNSAMDERMKAVEEALGDGEGSVADQMADLKQEVLGTAAQDATDKANKALADSKTYTNEEVAKDRARLDALEADTHSHANQAELDKIAEGDKAKWDAAAEKAHEHENAEVLDGITAEKVAAWDAAEANAIKKATELDTATNAKVDKNASDISALQGAVETLQSVEYVEATSEEIQELFSTTE